LTQGGSPGARRAAVVRHEWVVGVPDELGARHGLQPGLGRVEGIAAGVFFVVFFPSTRVLVAIPLGDHRSLQPRRGELRGHP
jgi:hypothetical protein